MAAANRCLLRLKPLYARYTFSLQSRWITTVDRNTSTNQISSSNKEKESELSYQVGSFVGGVKQSLARYMARGLAAKCLYERCADGIEYEQFFKACKMPDTFQSWFYIMHLHVWMILVRLKNEGKFGKNISYQMVEIMWQDVEQRVKLIGVEDTSDRRETMEELAQQFFGLIIAYDEGLLSHDTVLASALWRNLFYNKQNTDAESLALLVDYVRKQIQHLELLHVSDDILLKGQVDWLPLNEGIIELKQTGS